MDRRIYRVETPKGTKLIRANSPAQAIRHAAKPLFKASVATQEELVELLGNDIKPEEAGEEAPE